MSQSRRTLLKRGAGLLGVGATTAVAGCSDAVDQATGEFDSGYAAFFALKDWTNHVAGDNAEFESPLEVGQMGHGWEPTGDLTAEVASADAFVYLDTPEFSWAQDLAHGLETDYDDVAVIDGLVGLEDQFLDWDHEHDDDHGHDDDHDDDHDHDHDDDHDHDLHVDTFELIDREHDEVIAYIHGDHWDGSLPVVEEDEYVSLGANAEDDHGDHIHFDDGEYRLNAHVVDGDADSVSIESHGDHVHVNGVQHGHADLAFLITHDGHTEWESPAIELDVGSDHDDHGHDDEDDDHGHDDDHDDHGHDDDHDDHGHDDEDDDHGHDDDHDHDVHVAALEIIDREHDEAVADVHGDHWHGGLPDVAEGEYLSLGAEFTDDHGDRIHLGEDEAYQLHARVADGADEIVSVESHGDHVHVTGEEHGRTELVFQLYHDDHADWESPPLALSVVHEDEADDHGHGFHDPHVWVDPVLAQDVVDNIADGLARADPDNAEAYFENADAYKSELDAVDEAFGEMMADAERTVALLAGHDSFQYLEVRYGFELYSPVGVSPDEEPSQNDIADTIEFVNDNDIDVVLYDRFESPTLAETIVENSDATETMAVSPAEGTTEEWNEQGYGYVDQMLEVNVPAFRRALGAE